MSDVRAIQVRMTVSNSQYIAGMRGAAAATTQTGTAMEAVGRSSQQHLAKVGTTARNVGILAAGGLALAAKSTMGFDKQMSAAAAATDASTKSMGQLRQAALQAGADTSFSASEAAEGITELGKAGVSTADILGGGLKGALDLAAAGQIGVGEAAETSASAMNQFGLKGRDVTHIADLLSSAADAAQGGVSEMGQALNQVGLVANQTGLSIEETTGALAMFASKGLLGSDAGTSFKTMLMSLVPKSAEAGKLMDHLGFSAFDAHGKFVGLEETARRLREALKDMSDEQRQAALKTMFGSDAIRAASILYEQGGKGVQKWTDKVNDTGHAADRAAQLTDNLAGDIERLGGSLETALIGTGEGSTGMLRNLTQSLEGLVNEYNDLGPSTKSAVSGTLGFVAASGGMVWATTRVASGLQNMAANASSMGSSLAGANKSMMLLRGGAGAAGLALVGLGQAMGQEHDTARAFSTVIGGALTGLAVGGPWGAAVGAGIGLIGSFGQAHAEAAGEVAQLTGTLNTQTGEISGNTRAWVAHNLQQKGALDQAQELGVSMQTVVSAALGNEAAIKRVANAYAAWKEANKGNTGENPNLIKEKGAWEDLLGTLKNVKGRVDDVTKSRREEILASLTAAKAVQDLSTSYQLTPKQVRTAIALDNAGATESTMRRVLRAYGLTPTQIRTFLRAIDFMSPVTKKVKAQLQGVPARVTTALAAMNYKPTMSQLRSLVRQYNLTPKQVRTIVKALGIDPTKGQMRDVIALAKNVDRQHPVVSVSQSGAQGAKSALNALYGEATRLNGTVVNIRTVRTTEFRTVRSGLSTGRGDALGARGMIMMGDTQVFAGGGILTYGDVANRHQPVLAGPGTTRVWREPETQGEAYIPLANDDRRTRAKAILAQTATYFGGQVQWMARGGITAGVATGGVSAASLRNLRLSGVLRIPGIGEAILDGARLVVGEALADRDASDDRAYRAGV